MSVYCLPCLTILPEEMSACPKCGGMSFSCLGCHAPLRVGKKSCEQCGRTEIMRPDPVDHLQYGIRPDGISQDDQRSSGARVALATVPTAARATLVPEVYQAGKFGVSAEARMVPGDVVVLNELGKLVELLHAMASRTTHFAGLTEHTRKMIRDMRILATDIQEEIEMRRGPQG